MKTDKQIEEETKKNVDDNLNKDKEYAEMVQQE